MSNVKVTTIKNIDGTKEVPTETVIAGSAKAWVNFDGTTNTGGLCIIRDDFNVSSITDTTTGVFVINFDTNMSSANFAVSGANFGSSNAGFLGCLTYELAVDSVKVYSYTHAGAAFDSEGLFVVIHSN